MFAKIGNNNLEVNAFMVVSLKTYEQYCVFLKKNIIIEEVLYKNGNKQLNCVNSDSCKENGKCQNSLVKNFYEINI